MRPQRKAGENHRGHRKTFSLCGRFNEAPAQSWGKRSARTCRRPTLSGFNEAPAQSWGKPRFAQEYSLALKRFNEAPAQSWGKPEARGSASPVRSCFNEAPAQSWGKRKYERQNKHRVDRFNEAPAQSWGKLGSLSECRSQSAASMRPQRKAGENRAPALRVLICVVLQ